VMGVHGLTWDLMPVGGMIAGTIAEFAGAPAAVAVGAVFVAGLGLWVIPLAPRFSGAEQPRDTEAAATEGPRPITQK
jgi:hypothetical protein